MDWALAGLPAVSLGAYFAANGLAVLGAIGYTLLVGGLVGIVLGSIGFVVGSGARSLVAAARRERDLRR